MDISRCMLKQKGMSNSLWGKEVTLFSHLLNRHRTRRLKNKVLKKVWSGKKPYVNHLKVRGSIFHKNVSDDRRKKLDDKSEAMILVGYHKLKLIDV